MSQSNLLQGYTWDAQYDDSQQQFSRPIQDEVISVYEVYVKEETIGADGHSDISIVSGEPGSSGHLMQSDCLDLDAAIGSEVINVDGTITKLLGKDTVKYKILDQNVNEDNVVVYSHPVSEGPSSTTQLVDKDDPRSRLHFVKYLKRDGKTLKIWECGICSKEFRHQYTLMRHLPTHTDERNFKCEACGKAFRQLSTLSQHRAIHSDARPYVCEFCKKTFNRVSTLISHRKTHSEHKPHKCHLCGKGFHQKGNLRNHVFTHTNERPYKCETCGKGFNQMSNLMCHKVKAHAHAEKMQYVCGICGKEFPRRFSLRSHEEYKHGIKYRHSNAPVVLQENMNVPGVVRNKNASIVSLTNGERPMIAEVQGDKENFNPAGYTGSMIVDKIETKAMENAVLEGQTPFALFKPVKGIPVLVKVANCPTANRKQVLTPATAEDLRMAGKMTVSPTLADLDGVKAVQIKVPVVATVTQRIEPDGSYSFLVEPPGPGQEQESLIEPIESQFSCPDNRALDLRGELDKNSQDQVTNSGSAEDCNDLLELAAQGGIQFVRATEDGRYEVMTNSEARDLMAQNSHDVTILDGEEAEAISVANLRGQQQNEQISHSQNQEIIIGDSNNQITVLNSGGNSLMQKNTLPIDGIEILEDKDIRILHNSKNSGNDHEGRFALQNGVDIFEHEKMDDFSFGGKELGILGQNNLRVSNHLQSLQPNSLGQNPFFKNSQMNSFLPKNFGKTGISLMNHNFQNFKHNNSFCDSISTILSSNDHSIAKNQPIDVHPKLKFPDFDTSDNFIQPEVKILGSKGSQNKVKILGHSMDKAEIEKVLNFGNPPTSSSDTVKILGAKNPPQSQGDYKDLRILGSSTGQDQFNGGISQRKDQVKILGKKKDPIYGNNNNNGGGFEVTTSILERGELHRVPETIVIRDSPQRGINKSADFLQASYKSSMDQAGDTYCREFDGASSHLNAYNDHHNRMSNFDDVIYIDDNIRDTSISDRDFGITGHYHSARYYDLPDLD